jgi:hypothetical protein
METRYPSLPQSQSKFENDRGTHSLPDYGTRNSDNIPVRGEDIYCKLLLPYFTFTTFIQFYFLNLAVEIKAAVLLLYPCVFFSGASQPRSVLHIL